MVAVQVAGLYAARAVRCVASNYYYYYYYYYLCLRPQPRQPTALFAGRRAGRHAATGKTF